MLTTLLFKFSAFVWRSLSAILPRRNNSITLCTYPDFDDTLRAMQIAAANRNIFIDLLVASDAPRTPDWVDPQVVRVHSKSSIKGIFAFHRSTATLYTHGLYSKFPILNSRPTLNLWHGMPIKKIASLDPRSGSTLPKSHWVIADDEFFRPIMASAFDLKEVQVIIMEHPRLDILMSPPDRKRLLDAPGSKLLLWMPTYRRSTRGEIRSDSRASPIPNEHEMRRLDAVLGRLDATLLIKLHPMETIKKTHFPVFERIEIVDDDVLRQQGLSLYQLLGMADGLITDISSVFFDFRRTGRPIWIYFPDKDQYDASRGFVAPLDQLVDRPILSDFCDLIEDIELSFAKTGGVRRETELKLDGANKALDLLLTKQGTAG